MAFSICGWMSGIFSGINKFDLPSSSATKIKSKVVGLSFGVQCIYDNMLFFIILKICNG